MTDQIDKAQEFEAMHRRHALDNRAPELPFKGECYNCEEPVTQGCFCDAYCRDDYELREKQKGRFHASAN